MHTQATLTNKTAQQELLTPYARVLPREVVQPWVLRRRSDRLASTTN